MQSPNATKRLAGGKPQSHGAAAESKDAFNIEEDDLREGEVGVATIVLTILSLHYTYDTLDVRTCIVAKSETRGQRH